MRKQILIETLSIPDTDTYFYEYKIRHAGLPVRTRFSPRSIPFLAQDRPSDNSRLLGRYESDHTNNGLQFELQGRMTPVTLECAERSDDQILSIAHAAAEALVLIASFE